VIMEETIHEECKSCRLGYVCTLTSFDNEFNCPCKQCLVKVMCRQICVEYQKYILDISKSIMCDK